MSMTPHEQHVVLTKSRDFSMDRFGYVGKDGEIRL